MSRPKAKQNTPPLIIEVRERSRVNMRELNQELQKQTEDARAMLMILEKALVKCGYLNDESYNSHQSGFTSRGSGKRHVRATVIQWKGGKILLSGGYKRDSKGNPIKHGEHSMVRWIKVSELGPRELIKVACHLATFVDHLENNTRHLRDSLLHAIDTTQAMIEKIQENPRPTA